MTYELDLESQEDGLDKQKERQGKILKEAEPKVCTERAGPNR